MDLKSLKLGKGKLGRGELREVPQREELPAW